MEAVVRQLVAEMRELESPSSESSGEDMAGVRCAQLLVGVVRLRRMLAVLANLDDVRSAVQGLSRSLGGKEDRALLMRALEAVVARGHRLAFAAVECAQWLCLDTRLRRCLLLETRLLEALTGAGLGACAQAKGENAAGDAMVAATLRLLDVCMLLDPHWTSSRMKQAHTHKFLRRADPKFNPVSKNANN